MIKAKHHFLVVLFFRIFTLMKIRRSFHQIIIRGKIDVAETPVLVLANHTSWWDGFWVLYLNIKLLKKKFHFMMDEIELSKRWLFSYTGGFSIAPQSRSIFDTLKYTSGLLSDSRNMVLIFPQGKLYSSITSEVKFKRGIERIETSANIQPKVVFLVMLTDYFQFEKPTLYIYMEEASSEVIQQKQYEKGYNQFLQQVISQHKEIAV